jgi:hypothetical protein
MPDASGGRDDRATLEWTTETPIGSDRAAGRMGRWATMFRRIPRVPGLPLGGGLELLLAAGGAYFAWEHGEGRHAQPHVLCPICWLNKIAPAPEASESSSQAEPQE